MVDCVGRAGSEARLRGEVPRQEIVNADAPLTPNVLNALRANLSTSTTVNHSPAEAFIPLAKLLPLL